MKMKQNNFVIIEDTREKNGWDFDGFEECKATIQRGLKTGDYTLEGLEDVLCIERKASTGELAMNLGKKQKQFDAEIERMSEFRWAYILCEFSIDNLMQFPKGSTIPPRRWKYLRMNGKFMWRKICEYKEQYGIETLFCDTKENAEESAMQIFNRVSEMVNREQSE